LHLHCREQSRIGREPINTAIVVHITGIVTAAAQGFEQAA